MKIFKLEYILIVKMCYFFSYIIEKKNPFSVKYKSFFDAVILFINTPPDPLSEPVLSGYWGKNTKIKPILMQFKIWLILCP